MKEIYFLRSSKQKIPFNEIEFWRSIAKVMNFEN